METITATDLDQVTTDQLEQLLVGCEARIAQQRAFQILLLSELDRRQVATADGARTLADWLSARLDTTHDTAKNLVATARTLQDLPVVSRMLTDGKISYDRVSVVCRFPSSHIQDSEEWVHHTYRHDLHGLRRLAARHRRITRSDETEAAHNDHFLVMQPDLFDLTWKLWGRLTATDGAVVEHALQQRGDALGCLPDGNREPRNARMATGLVSICHDTLDGSLPADDTPNSNAGADVTVFIDGHLAAATGGEAGAEIASGPRIGPQTLQEMLCTGKIGVLTHLPDGTLVRIGDHTQAIPPAVRRYVHYRDGGVCTVDGCTSRYRLQPHHHQPRTHEGDNHPDNLPLLCWYHHHRVIHQLGYRIDPRSRIGRIRLLPPQHDPP